MASEVKRYHAAARGRLPADKLWGFVAQLTDLGVLRRSGGGIGCWRPESRSPALGAEGLRASYNDGPVIVLPSSRRRALLPRRPILGRPDEIQSRPKNSTKSFFAGCHSRL